MGAAGPSTRDGPDSAGWDDLGSTDQYTLLRKAELDHPTGVLYGRTVIEGVPLGEILATIRDDGCRRIWDMEMYDHTEFKRFLSDQSLLIRAVMKGKVTSRP